jgi:magnesium-transporting ATPase (P-type)
MAQAEKVAADGFRVLALAEGDAPQGLDLSRPPDLLPNLTFLGFVGMIDPLRPGVREAVSVCRQAGITTLMVTGDHPVTALAIARDLGLANRPEEVVTGDLLEGKSPEELLPIVEKARVFARVAPRQKLELVEAAQRAGHFVAVTGDGANDAPALRAANIGVAMGRGGTDVAREAAEMVLSDDNFATIVAGVEEGRVAYDNIRKEIYMVISTGAAEVLIVLIALGLGLPLPLTAVQFLWLNLVTNGIQDIALALEPGEQGILRRRPRSPEEPIFNRLMIERTIVAALVMSVICVAAFGWMLDRGWNVVSARNVVLLLMVLFQNIHLGNCRSESLSVFRLSPLTSPVLLAGAIGTQLLHLGMLYLPIGQELLHTEPVSARTWAVLLGLALSILLVMELHKWIWSLRPGVSTEEFTDDRARHHGGPRHRGGTGNDPG